MWTSIKYLVNGWFWRVVHYSTWDMLVFFISRIHTSCSFYWEKCMLLQIMRCICLVHIDFGPVPSTNSKDLRMILLQALKKTAKWCFVIGGSLCLFHRKPEKSIKRRKKLRLPRIIRKRATCTMHCTYTYRISKRQLLDK